MRSSNHGRTRDRRAPTESLLTLPIVVLSLIVRIAYLLEVRGHPLFSRLTGDPALYREQAMAILQGTLAPPHAYFHSSPLYPWFLAAIGSVSTSLDAVRIAQTGVGVVTVLLVTALARRAFSSPAAFAAGTLTALYVPFIFFEAEFLEITLVLAFVAGSLLLLLRSGGRLSERRGGAADAAGAGLLLGLAALGKPNLLLFAPVGSVWLATRGFGRFAGDRRSPRSPWLQAAVIFFAVTGLAVLPATVHNYRVEGDLIPVSSNAGINLWIGNHEGASGMFSVPPEMRLDLRAASKAVAERAAGRELSAGEVSDHWASLATTFIREHPGAWLRLTAGKFALFWNHYEIPNHYDLGFVKTFAPVLRFPVGTFAVVAPLGILGLVLCWRRRATPLLAAFGLAFMASVLPFFITGRYRLAVAIVLLPAAGCAVVELIRRAVERQRGALVASLLLLAALAVGVNVDLVEFGPAPMHNTVGAILGEQGDMVGAAESFARAVAADPEDISSRYNLGVALMRLRRASEAEEHFRVATELYPNYHEAWIGLGRSLAVQDRLDAAVESWRRVLSSEPPAPEAARAEARDLIEAAEALREDAGAEAGR
jgi:tetratricopeptide (TPR) repeat protein